MFINIFFICCYFLKKYYVSTDDFNVFIPLHIYDFEVYLICSVIFYF